MNENPRFTNTTILTDNQFAKMGEAEHKYRNRTIRKIMTVVAILLVILAVAVVITGKMSMLAVVSAIVIVILYVTDRYCCKYRADREREYIQAVRGENPNIIYEFYEKYISMNTGKSRVNINYEQIDCMFETNDMYIFILGGTSLVVAKDGFMSGNREVFSAFIKEKIGENDGR